MKAGNDVRNNVLCIFLFLMFCLWIAHPGSALADASATMSDVNKDGKEEVILENEFLRLAIAPHYGAQAVSVVLKEENKEIILANAEIGGIFSDHDFRQGWPGEMHRAEYEAKIVNKGPDAVSAVFTRTFSGKWRGGSIKTLEGLNLNRTVTLRTGMHQVEVSVSFHNPTSEGKLIEYWVQNIFALNKEPGKDVYYRPTSKGIACTWVGEGQEMLNDPTDGWSGAVDAKSGWAAVFTMDYNYIKTLYDCMGSDTIEWMYERMAIPPGQTWTTAYQVSFAKGFDALVYASPRFMADVKRVKDGEGTRLVHILSSPAGKLEKLELFTSISGMGNARVYMVFDVTMGKSVERVEGEPDPACDMPELAVRSLGHDAKRFDLAPVPGKPGPKIVYVRVEGAGKEENYECGLTDDGGLMSYPRKVKSPKMSYLKPAKMELGRDGKLDFLYIREGNFGLNVIPGKDDPKWLGWDIESALAGISGSNVKNSFYSYAAYKYRGEFEDFPATYDEIFKYDVIIFEAGNAEALGGYGREMLADFVSLGGGLLFLGGYRSFGKGGYPEHLIRDILPVETTGNWDLVETNGVVQVKTPEFAGIGRIDWNQDMKIFWYQKVRVKPDTKVLLSLDGDPLLVATTYKKGRVLAFTGTTLVSDWEREKQGFWHSDSWKKLVCAMILYLGGGF